MWFKIQDFAFFLIARNLHIEMSRKQEDPTANESLFESRNVLREARVMEIIRINLDGNVKSYRQVGVHTAVVQENNSSGSD